MKRICTILFIILVLNLFVGCTETKTTPNEETVKIQESTEDEVKQEEQASEAEEIVLSSFNWEETQNEDPIFTWEDPYPGQEWNEIEGLSDDEAFALLKKRSALSLAKRNYRAYYYFLSGQSECDYRRVEKNKEYESPIVYLGSAIYPDDIIKFTLVDYLVRFHVIGMETTETQSTEDEKTVKKDLAMGEPEMIEYTHILCEKEECLQGEWIGGETFSISTSLLSNALIDELLNSGKTFIAYMSPVMSNYETNEYAIVNLDKGNLYEFCISADHLFSLDDGGLQSYSSVSDILAMDGKSPEELVETVQFLSEKYGKEMLERLRPGDLITNGNML